MIKAGWNIILETWKFRNDTVHSSENIDMLEGLPILHSTVEKEWQAGLGQLPANDFSHLFRIKINNLLKKSTQSKKDWLLTVKLGRNLHNDNTTTTDEFDSNHALRDWIGLAKTAA